MIKKYTLKLIIVLSIALFLPVAIFAYGDVVGYSYGKDYVNPNNHTSFPSSLQLDRLTHVIASDIGCYGDGSLFTGKLPNMWNGNKNLWLSSLVNRAQAKGVKVSICVGGDTLYFPQATNSANLTTFVSNIVDFVNVHGFDGVNIDWEYPRNATEWNQCIALLNALKNNLPSGKTITIALSHSKHIYSNYTHVPQQILSIADGIYLMTYDEGDSAWPSHSNLARSILAINEWVSWQTPTCAQKKKLFMGSAFYGWHTAGNDSIRIPYRDYILNNDTLWYSNPGDVPTDARDKAIHTRDNGYGGVFIWELGYDVPANQSNSLLKAIHDVMPTSSGPTIVCNTSTEFNLSILPPGSTVSWNKSSNLTYLSGQNTTQYNIKAASSATSGAGWVQATINGPCGQVQLPRQNLWVGVPLVDHTNVTLENTFGASFHWCSTHYGNTFAHNAQGQQIQNYSARLLTWPQGNIYSTAPYASPGSDLFGFVPQNWYTFELEASNACGNSALYTTEVEFADCYSGEDPWFEILATPNPASGYINIDIKTDQETAQRILPETQIIYRIFDNNRSGLHFTRNTTLGQSKQTFDVSRLHKGVYIILATINNLTVSRQIIIQ